MRVRRILLAPLSWLYGSVIAVRNWLYDNGIAGAAHAAVPVISVGNVRAGGTGKTPLVVLVARMVMERGFSVGILSRGYGRATTGFRLVSDGTTREHDVRSVGDEPALLADSLPGAIVAVDEDRVRGARRLVEDHRVSVIVLDDGFQHRRLHRDLDIVAVTAKELIEGDALIPAGMRREPLGAVQRAGVVVITQCRDAAEAEIARHCLPQGTAAVVCAVRTRLHGFRGAAPATKITTSALQKERFFAFSGIAQPDSFVRSLEGLGLQVVGSMAFGDHHWYTANDIARVRSAADACGATRIVTTEKDAVRLTDPRPELIIAVMEHESLTGLEECATAVMNAVGRMR